MSRIDARAVTINDPRPGKNRTLVCVVEYSGVRIGDEVELDGYLAKVIKVEKSRRAISRAEDVCAFYSPCAHPDERYE